MTSLCSDISSLLKRTDNELDAILHFHMHTSLAYKLALQWISQHCGSAFSAKIPATNSTVNDKEFEQHLADYESRYMRSLGLQQVTSLFEAFTFDLMRLILIEFPRHLGGDKKIAVSRVISAKSLDAILRDVVDEELGMLRYKSVSEWFSYLNKIVRVGYPSEDEIAKIVEFKASRDLLVHNDGVINRIYLGRVGELARGLEGDTLPVTADYFHQTVELIRTITRQLASRVMCKFESSCDVENE